MTSGLVYHPQFNGFCNPLLLFGLPAVYLAVAIRGHFHMADRQTPDKVAILMRLYNVAQILLCGYMTVGLAPVVGFPNIFGIGSAYTASGEWFMVSSASVQTSRASLCRSADTCDLPDMLQLQFVHYMSKYLDWLDTLWMVLKKKSSAQMSLLHLYHHATIGMIWGYLLSVGHANGTAR